MNLLHDFSPGLFIIQAIILLVLILLMRKFAWKPILDSLNSREEGIQGALDAAENAKKELQNLQADNERIMKEARELKTNMIAEAKSEAEAEAEKVVKQAQDAIVAEKKAAVADLKNQVASISVEIAEKVVKNELADKDKQLALVSSLLEDVKLN